MSVNNNKLDLSINLFYDPTPPPQRGFNQPSPIITIPPQPSLNPSDGFKTAAFILEREFHTAYDHVNKIGKNIENLKQLAKDLANPSISHVEYFNRFKTLIEEPHFQQILKITDEKLLKENFRHLLRMTDFDGYNLIEQIICFKEKERSLAHAVAELKRIRSLCIQTMLPDTSQAEKQKLLEALSSLSTPAALTLGHTVWIIDGKPENVGEDYGLRTAKANATTLIIYKGKDPIELAIKTLSNEKPPLELKIAHTHEEVIPSSASQEMIEEIKKLYDLENLYLLIQDPWKNNAILVNKFDRSHPHIKDIFARLVWVAAYEPNQYGFGEEFIRRNVRNLLKIQDDNKTNLISLLIQHQKEKIKHLKRINEISCFIKTANKDKAQQLAAFKAINSFDQLHLCGRIWLEDGGKTDPHFKADDHNYGYKEVEKNPARLLQNNLNSLSQTYLTELQQRLLSADDFMIKELENTVRSSETVIDASPSQLEKTTDLIRKLPPNLRIAIVTAEYQNAAGIGGLAPAVAGLAQAHGSTVARVVMPLYRGGPIKDDLIKEMYATRFKVNHYQNSYTVYKTKIQGIRCYFIDYPNAFAIPKKEDGSSGNFYNGDCRRRFAIFQSLAEQLLFQFTKKKKPIQLVHCNDSQTALIPKLLKTRHPLSESPVTVFTFHNNQETFIYDDACAHCLEEIGLPKYPINSFVSALEEADFITTVSPTFAKTAQTEKWGNHVHREVRRSVLQGKLAGICNGNTVGSNISSFKQLEKWTEVGTDKTIDLRFDTERTDEANKLHCVDQLKKIKQELCKYLASRPKEAADFALLDPTQPILFCVTRYDSYQKGIDKLEIALDITLASGWQCVFVGIEPDSKAKEILDRMQKKVKDRGNKGALVLVDEKKDGTLVHQSIWGQLARVAADLYIGPSKFEPFGLIPTELGVLGVKAFVTGADGFKDTVIPGVNGYHFDRLDDYDWDSKEQNEEFSTKLQNALQKEAEYVSKLYSSDPLNYIEHRLNIIQMAMQWTWESLPNGALSPIRLYDLAYAKAFVNHESGETIRIHLHPFKS